MIRNETRESAHLKSRVKDLSVVPNLVSFTGLFAAITPIAKLEKNPETGFYDPILIRDTDSLIANFGDPRIDPEKYIDLYSIMQVVGNGTSCYVTKVDSGEAGIYEFAFVPEENIINKTETAGQSQDEIDIARITSDNGFDVTDNAVTISSVHNKYILTKLVAHKDASTANKAHAELRADPSDPDSELVLSAEAKDTGEGGNKLSIEIIDEMDNHFSVRVYEDDVIVGDPQTFDGTDASTFEDANGLITLTGTMHAWAKAKLDGGSSESPERDWQIDPNNYTFDHVKVADADPVEYDIEISLTDSEKPNKIYVKSAELDPDYGREDIILIKHNEEDQKSEFFGKNVWVSKGLDRKYTIMGLTSQASGSDPEVLGSDAYTVKWKNGNNGKYDLYIVFEDSTVNNPKVTSAARQSKSIIAYSSMADPLDITCTLSQAKPYSLKLFYLNVEARSHGNLLGTAKVKLEPTTTNQALVNNINSSLGTYARFELLDKDMASAAEQNDFRGNSIVYNLLEKYAPYTEGDKPVRQDLELNPKATPLPAPSVLSQPEFKVMLQNYIDAQMQYKDRKYVGCLMADFTAPVTHRIDPKNSENEIEMASDGAVMPIDSDERRALHYNLKQVACERKDSTVVLSTPYYKGKVGGAAMPYDTTPFTLDEVCAWVSSQGDYADLWEYGSGNTTDYSIQSFYLEIYYSWLNMQCTKIENGLAKSVKVKVAPSNVVVNNILTSWRERGVQYPVAGDQYGTLSDMCTILQNPKTKLERDQLVQYRINPIWDTGTRGIQIYGNETLNAGYTDLNAAHIARTLVYIRSRVDEYTETLKFLINSQVLWDTWKNYVTTNILQPLQSANALSSYRVTMGNDTTSREEIANRMIKGNIELTFYQSAEIFDLSFIVYSSATTVEEANPL